MASDGKPGQRSPSLPPSLDASHGTAPLPRAEGPAEALTYLITMVPSFLRSRDDQLLALSSSALPVLPARALPVLGRTLPLRALCKTRVAPGRISDGKGSRGAPPAAAFSVKTREFSSSNLDFGGVPRTVTPVFYTSIFLPPSPRPPASRGGERAGKRAINKKKAERVVEVTPPKKQRRKKLVKKKKRKGTMAKKSKKGQDNINRYVSSSRGGKPRALGWLEHSVESAAWFPAGVTPFSVY